MSVPKWGGRDCELSSTGIDAGGQSIDSWKVTREILDGMEPALASHQVRVWTRDARWTRGCGHGYNSTAGGYGGYSGGLGYASGVSVYSRDCLRHWTAGGQCYYSDMGHVECCTAATKSPREFAAQCVSTLLAAEAARRWAEQQAEPGTCYALTTANTDALDPAISFGTHLSMSIEKWLWEELFVESRHPALFGFVTSALAAAIPFFGAGYIMPLKDGSVVYSLSGRAHHLTKMKTLSTTEAFNRGLLNSRREPHGVDQERLHLIGFDFCVLSSALLFSFLQCVLAAAEEGYCGMVLYDPLRALRSWSWRIDLRTGRLPATALMIDGRRPTLPAYLGELAAVLLNMCEQGLITEEIAPQAQQLLPLVVDLARAAEQGDLLPCSRHLSWASKLLWLTQLCEQSGGGLADPEIRLADHDFSHTDPRQGALWQLWEEGLVDPLISLDTAHTRLAEGPAESRDWGRGRIIDKFYDFVADVDWSYVDLTSDQDRWSPRLRIDLSRLDRLNKAQCASLIEAATDPAHLSQLLNAQVDGAARCTDPIEEISQHLAQVHQVGLGVPSSEA